MPIGLLAKSRKSRSQPRSKQRGKAYPDSLVGTQPDRHGHSGGFSKYFSTLTPVSGVIQALDDAELW
jgi:hypothetical protein